jgi:hypothetical protein
MSENSFEARIQHLTTEEINTLQVDACLRILGENNNILNEVNTALIEAMTEELKARTKVMQLKETKRALVQQLKTLSVIAARA